MPQAPGLPTMAVPILVFVAVIAIGGAVLTVMAVRRRIIRSRLEGGGQGGAQRPESDLRLMQVVEGVGAMVSKGRTSSTLRQKLATAGYHGAHTASVFLGVKMLLLLAGIAGLSLLVVPLDAPVSARALLVLCGAALASFLPNWVVHLSRERRRQDVRHHLPDALDLLEICVSSGMGIDTAWNSVADEVREVSPTLADEMALTNLELHLGAARTTAMRHLAERTGVQEVSSLVGVLIQSERFGTSVAEALRTFARSMRETRSAQAEIAAEKMAIKLLFPMILFIFPCILIVTVGPAGIILTRILLGGSE